MLIWRLLILSLWTAQGSLALTIKDKKTGTVLVKDFEPNYLLDYPFAHWFQVSIKLVTRVSFSKLNAVLLLHDAVHVFRIFFPNRVF